MKSYFNFLPLLAITLILTACGGTDSTTGETAGMPSDGVTQTDVTADNSTPPSVADSTTQQVISARITSGMDDVEEQADKSMYVDSTDLELINDGEDQLVGLRFSLAVPKDAVITEANLRFTTDEASTSETDLVIWAQASDDAEPFTSSSGNISSRTATNANVIWKPQGWSNVGESGVAQTTSDLSSVVQEVIRRSGWQSDNHLVLVVSGQGSRTAESYEGSSSNAALLTVTYTMSGSAGGTEGNQTPSSSDATDNGGSTSTPATGDTTDNTSGDVTPPDTGTDSTSGDTTDSTSGDTSGDTTDTVTPPDPIIVNNPPQISGTPSASVTVGTVYSFTPSAVDPDGDSLSFTVSNLPTWASFDDTTGRVTGTPQDSDVGSYSNIQITVSDGAETAALNPFSITVDAATVVLGSINLDWTPPATRTDATALDISEIGGYVVYLGSSVDSLQEVVDISDSSVTTYTIDELELGTYYVALKIYDVDGNFSGLSNTVSIEVTN